jgi:hypothetical protein
MFGFVVRFKLAVLILMAVVAVPVVRWLAAADPVPPAPATPPLFAHWPQDQKPEAIIVLTGQTFGYLSPCGCSRPQRGGLERRFNFMQSLRAKGWPVVGADLGDVCPPRKILEQDYLKYETAMTALATMGYAAVGLGVYDFEMQLDQLIGKYALQHADKPPTILAANLGGLAGSTVLPRKDRFPGAGMKATIEAAVTIAADPITNIAMAPVGITAVIGRNLFESKIAKIDPQWHHDDTATALKNQLAVWDVAAVKPAVKVLLYAGSLDDAKKLAADFPAFNVILCQIEESEPPQFPTVVNNGKTFIVQVGHKGQNVGAIGVFRENGAIKLAYQLVPLGEEYLTAADMVATQPILKLLEQYTANVRDRNLMKLFTDKPVLHAAQVQHPDADLTYVGSDKCKTCHPQEFVIWEKAHHSHAMEALEKRASQPGHRQFDGECVVCHAVGFGIKGGYTNEKETPHLRHNGCENCHGPGSGHVAKPNDKALRASLVAWRNSPDDKLPPKATLEALAKGQPAPVPLTANQQRVMGAVGTMCLRCHDGENDPKFDLNLYMPKIWHSGFKAAAQGGLPGIAK